MRTEITTTLNKLMYKAIAFGLVGASGIIVHLSILHVLHNANGYQFMVSQAIAAGFAMSWNFCLHNLITFSKTRLSRKQTGTALLKFLAISGIGAVLSVLVSSTLFAYLQIWWLAGLTGIASSFMWNFLMSAFFVWRYDDE